MSRRYNYLAALVGVVCVYAIVRLFVFPHAKTVRNDIVQGALVGAGLAFVTVQVLGITKAKKANGWTTILGCGLPGNGMLTRAACTQAFPGPINAPQEAVYWWANSDGAGRTLSGQHSYIMHFPPGGLPPNEAFWSLTMADARNRFVPNPIGRFSVGDRSGLA